MAYEGGYQANPRPYPGAQQPRPPPARGPGPYPPHQPRYDGYNQGDPGYDYYEGDGYYGPEYDEQYQNQGYAGGLPPDQRHAPRSRSDFPPQGRGGPPMGAGRAGPGGPLQRSQTMEPMGNGPYPSRGAPPPGPGRGYPNAPPARGAAPGGYGRGPPLNMETARSQGRPPMNGSMQSPVSDRFPGNGPQPYPSRDAGRGGYGAEAQLSNQMAGMDISQRSGMPMHRHSGGSLRNDGSGSASHLGHGAPNHHDQGYSQDTRSGPAPPAGPGGGFGPPSRSMTMPVNESMGQRQPMPPSDPMRPAPLRSATSGTSNGSRPPPQRYYPSNSQGPPQDGYGASDYAQSGSSYDDIYDSYAAAPPPGGKEYQALPPPVPNDDMPNFDKIAEHASRESVDLHLTPGNSATPNPPPPPPAPEGGRGMPPRTKSQPDLRSQNAAYEMAGDAPPMPAPPPSQYGRGVPGRGMPTRNPSAPGPGLPTNPGPRTNGAMRPTLPPQALDNPDALPSHPTPVRPGLMADSVVNIAKRPPPVRNYTNQSPASVGRGGAGPPANVPPSKAPPPPVTPDELEHLRAVYKSNTNSYDAGLKYAKKLVEASESLVLNIPDARARSRARDKYVADAHKVLKRHANGSHKEGMYFFADCLGRGVFGHEPDHKEAFALYQSAAKMGHAAAAYRTAVCCEIGHEDGGGTRRDPLKAIQWYKRSATLGDTPAMYKMGMIQLKGLLGQPRNPREAIGWLKRAADQADAENPHSLHELGLLYESAAPEDVIIRDEGYAFSLFKRAAELGYKFSQFRLGCAYEYGLMACPIDPRMSIMWYSKAAVQQEHQAELALSGWYLTGSEGVLNQSDTEAYLWARKAAMAGLAKAEYAMGYFTEVGIGTTANMDDAKRWYWRAAAQDLTKARERLEDLKRTGKSGPRQRERISRSKMQKQQEGECSVM